MNVNTQANPSEPPPYAGAPPVEPRLFPYTFRSGNRPPNDPKAREVVVEATSLSEAMEKARLEHKFCVRAERAEIDFHPDAPEHPNNAATAPYPLRDGLRAELIDNGLAPEELTDHFLDKLIRAMQKVMARPAPSQLPPGLREILGKAGTPVGDHPQMPTHKHPPFVKTADVGQHYARKKQVFRDAVAGLFVSLADRVSPPPSPFSYLNPYAIGQPYAEFVEVGGLGLGGAQIDTPLGPVVQVQDEAPPAPGEGF